MSTELDKKKQFASLSKESGLFSTFADLANEFGKFNSATIKLNDGRSAEYRQSKINEELTKKSDQK